VNSQQLSTRLTAISSPQRMRILAMLSEQPTHVSELARRVGMSRALLYMHLTKLEEAGFITGHHELTEDGKAMKVFKVVPFAISLDIATITSAVANDPVDVVDPTES
jgi:predicted transcriptional regulator